MPLLLKNQDKLTEPQKTEKLTAYKKKIGINENDGKKEGNDVKSKKETISGSETPPGNGEK